MSRRRFVVPPTDGSAIPALDGQVTNAAQVVSTATNAANAGKSYWMRGGTYTAIDLTGTPGPQPSSLITFITYPGEQVVMNSLKFGRARNLRFDGNSANRTRAANTTLPNGQYGLWIKGNGAFTTPGSGNQSTCLLFERSGPEWNENLQFANFRVGDVANSDWTQWRWQHGIVIQVQARNLLFEDFEIGYLGNDGVSGDFTAGGFGCAWQFGTGEEGFSGNYTFRRGHWHHSANDAVQYAGGGALPAETRFEKCLFAQVEFQGPNHTDALQIVGATQKLSYQDCAFDTVSQFLLQGAGANPRTFNNCLFHNVTNQLEVGKAGDNPPPGDYVIDSCTVDTAIRAEGTGTSNNKVRNSVYRGFYTTSGITPANLWANDGTANVKDSAATEAGLGSDVVAAVTFNSSRECTSHAQGWRKPTDFPWSTFS